MKKSANTKKSARTERKPSPKKKTGGHALPLDDSGTAASRPLRRGRSHRYKFAFIVVSYAGRRNSAGERDPGAIRALARSLDSICNQTDPDCRVIVVNDGHAPEMREMTSRGMAEHPHIPFTYIEAPYRGKRGGHQSVNTALSMLPMDCEFTAILNMDNELRPTYIEKMYAPDCDILTCMVKMHDIPGMVFSGDTFARRKIDRANYAVRADIAIRVEHKQHLDADCDFILDCACLAENGIHYVEEILADHH